MRSGLDWYKPARMATGDEEPTSQGGTGVALVPVGERRLARPRIERVAFSTRVQGRRLGAFFAAFLVGFVGLFAALAAFDLPMWAMMMGGGAIGLLGGTLANFGRQRLRRLAEAEEKSGGRAASLEGFERLALGPYVAEPVRMQAVGHAALAHLEAGDLDAALRWAETPMPDRHLPLRRRLPGMGFLGEVVRSLLGWLLPGRVEGVVHSSVFQVDEGSSTSAHPRFSDLRSALAALEAGAQGDRRGTVQAWSEVQLDALRRDLPTTAALLQAAVSRSVEALEGDLDAHLQRLPEASRALVLRLFPEWAEREARGYRREADGEADAPVTALDVRAPQDLRALEPSPGPSALLPAVPLWSSILMGVATLGMLGPGMGAYGLLLLLFVSPVIVGGPYHRWSRLRPLREAGIDQRAQIAELAHTGTRAATRRGALRTTLPFERGELMRIVGLHRAEEALRSGDAAAAREHVAWWLGALNAARLREMDTLPVFASMVRVATLLGMRETAARLAVWPTPRTRRPRRRSGRGSAPQAIALARALFLAHDGRWADAGKAVRQAASQRGVELAEFDRELYGALLLRLQARGEAIPGRFAWLVPTREADWVRAIWPEG